MHDASVLFSEPGLALKRPEQDILFIEDFVYKSGLHEEFSIAANYSRDPARKDRGFAACNWLALSREVPEAQRSLARFNLLFYVRPASKVMPSFAARTIELAPPEGFHALNPSVARHGDQLVVVQRCVNYDLIDNRYLTPDGGPIRTRNFLLHLDDELEILTAAEILPPRDMPSPISQRIKGFEDARLVSWRDELWISASFREANEEAWPEQVLARINQSDARECRLIELRMLRPDGPREVQKNWMPFVDGDRLQFVYLCDPTRIVDERGRTIKETVPPIAAEQFRGGSQAIAFDRGWLTLIHEVAISDGRRHYHHRFVWFDDGRNIRRMSRPFFFEHHGIEFAAGLAWHPDGRRLVLTYGVKDSEARIATVDSDDVRRMLEVAERLPAGERGCGAAQPPVTVTAGTDGGWSCAGVSDAGQQVVTGNAAVASPNHNNRPVTVNDRTLPGTEVLSREISHPAVGPDTATVPRNKLSGFVISCNRASIIETCLRSLRFVDELIVVDKSSDDGTLETGTEIR